MRRRATPRAPSPSPPSPPALWLAERDDDKLLLPSSKDVNMECWPSLFTCGHEQNWMTSQQSKSVALYSGACGVMERTEWNGMKCCEPPRPRSTRGLASFRIARALASRLA